MIPGTQKVLVDSWFPRKAMTRHENNNGATVLWIHHSADPSKDNAWAEDFAKTFPGGRKGGPWRSEMDGEADAYAGGRVFPDFSLNTHVIPRIQVPDEWPKWRVIDPGLENALACIFFTLDPFNEMLLVFDEHYQSGWPEIEKHAQVIKGKTGRHEIQYTLIDPSAFARTLAGGGTSVADLFVRHGIPCSPAYRAAHKRDQIPALAELIRVRDSGEPRFKVMDHCTNTIRELLGYRWKPKLHDDRNAPDEPVKFDDHAVDCCLYMAAAVSPERAAATFAHKDPLMPWYVGKDRKRVAADERRMRSVMRDHSGDEP